MDEKIAVSNPAVNYNVELKDIFNEIFFSEINREAGNNFVDVTKNLKPKSCKTKFGWHSGQAIDFTCMFEKGGTSDVITEMVNGIQYQSDAFYFIHGLCPDVFHFNTQFIVENDKTLTLMFKLIRDKRKEAMQ